MYILINSDGNKIENDGSAYIARGDWKKLTRIDLCTSRIV
jgi:hypothetical protein